MEIHEASFPDRVDVPTLTLNIPTEELRFLSEDSCGKRFFSKDEDAARGENAQSNVAYIYQSLSLSVPKYFTSLALRIPTDGSSLAKTLRSYGDVVLVFDLGQLANEILVLNGDVKNIGQKVAKTRDANWVQPIDPLAADFESKLKEMVLNSTSTTYQGRCRRVGSYFEARLPRPIVPSDVSGIYIAPGNTKALEYVRSFCPA